MLEEPVGLFGVGRQAGWPGFAQCGVNEGKEPAGSAEPGEQVIVRPGETSFVELRTTR